ncbi:hypothetical protein SAMN02910456_01561 [Ruminococcaceae bacterium YRB3002]|nr:hypothetical protein SAMN02910456_01561 [Ruminococcaceae bacterium YRB3002]
MTSLSSKQKLLMACYGMALRKTELGKFECNGSCSSCSGCSGKAGNNKGPCKGCIPKQGFQHMGVIWEVEDK